MLIYNMLANSVYRDQRIPSVVPALGLYCSHMYHKMVARLIWVKHILHYQVSLAETVSERVKPTYQLEGQTKIQRTPGKSKGNSQQ